MRTVRCVAILLLVLAGLTGFGRVAGVHAAPSGNRVALLIANAAYPDSDAVLPTPIADARALADELKRRDFSVDLVENQNKEAMTASIERFQRKIEPGSVALVFFGGYGIQVGRKNFLVPVDARIWSESDVLRDGIAFDALMSDMGKRGAATRIAILDASRRNPFERRFRSFSTGLAPAAASPGTLILYSAAAGSVVNETSATRSLFVTELIKQIGLPGQSAEQAFRGCRDAISRATRSQQIPALASSLEDPFYFDPSSKGMSPPAQSTALENDPPAKLQPKPQPEPEPEPKSQPGFGWSDPPSQKPGSSSQPEKKPSRPSGSYANANKDPDAPLAAEEEAVRDFDAAAAIGTKTAYQDFLDRHPSGSLAARARAEIARLDANRESGRLPSRPFTSAEQKRKAALDARIAKNARDEAAYYERGQFFAQRGDTGLAIADFDESLQLNPRNPEAYNNRCWMRAVANDLEQALDDCNQALKLRPNYVDALDSRGFVHLKVGAFRAAVDDYDAALRIDTNHSSALYGRGVARRRLGQTSQADRDFTAALQLNPSIDKEFAGYGLR